MALTGNLIMLNLLLQIVQQQSNDGTLIADTSISDVFSTGKAVEDFNSTLVFQNTGRMQRVVPSPTMATTVDGIAVMVMVTFILLVIINMVGHRKRYNDIMLTKHIQWSTSLASCFR